MVFKFLLGLPIPFLLSTFLLSCKKNLGADAEIAEALKDVKPETALNGEIAIRVNTQTNYLFVYKKGIATLKWQIATGKPEGKTPGGVFAVHNKVQCPSWNNGKKGEEEKKAEGCDPKNPLGTYVLWFHDGITYGLHGVNTEPVSPYKKMSLGMDRVTDPISANRSVSSGCIRNHPENAKWLFDNIPLNTKVVIESSPSDPFTARDCSGNEVLCATHWNPTTSSDSPFEGHQDPNPPLNPENPPPSSGAPAAAVPKTFPTWCSISSISSSVGSSVGMKTYAMARTEADVTDTLQAGAKVLVENVTNGEPLKGDAHWYNVSYTLQGQKKSAFIPASSVTCSN